MKQNKTGNYDLTIIVPIYNEADNIATLENRLSAFLPDAQCKACVLFVNDGSTDHSLQLIVDTCNRQADFFFLSFSRNSGLTAALKAGIDAAQSPYVGYMDADLQTAPEDFNRLLPYINDYELVTGIRADRKDSAWKKMQSKIANAFRRMMTHDGMQDTGCPLKVMHSSYAKRMPIFNGMHRFLPALMIMMGGRVKQIPVRHFPRTAGVSKFHMSNRLVAPFLDYFAYRWMKSRYINYHVAANNLDKA